MLPPTVLWSPSRMKWVDLANSRQSEVDSCGRSCQTVVVIAGPGSGSRTAEKENTDDRCL